MRAVEEKIESKNQQEVMESLSKIRRKLKKIENDFEDIQ